MAPSRSRTLSLVLFLFLAAVSLRPWPALDSALERAFEPARHLGLLCTPLSWLSAGEVRAAETALLADEAARRAAGRSVLLAAQSRAAPTREALARGRGLVHAEVVDRAADDPDRVLVRFSPSAPVAAGMPVVCGDYYVGRVDAVDPRRPGEASVLLVTEKDFRVTASVEGAAPTPDEPVRLVVGGVLPRGTVEGGASGSGPRELRLAVHFPSDPELQAGTVRVDEAELARAFPDDASAGLADGFLLGALERHRRGAVELLGVRPGLDYAAGLYQVAVVTPTPPAASSPSLARDPFDPAAEACWTEVALVLAGDPTFWREGRIVRAGRDRGLEDGAALALGAAFLGCVTRVGRSTSDASLLGDAGLEVAALASPLGPGGPGGEPAGPPITIGRLVSLGRDRSSGDALLRWDAAIPLPPERGEEGDEDAGAPIPVLLYTAAGERAVPPGLSIGSTELPRGRGPFVLRVRQSVDGRSLVRARVWRDPGFLAVRGIGAGPP